MNKSSKSMKGSKIFGIILIVLSVLIAGTSTYYSGNHLLPNSLQEFLVDVACCCVLYLGFTFLIKR